MMCILFIFVKLQRYGKSYKILLFTQKLKFLLLSAVSMRIFMS